MTKKYVGDIFPHVGDIMSLEFLIGHQHHNMPECDVGDWMFDFGA